MRMSVNFFFLELLKHFYLRSVVVFLCSVGKYLEFKKFGEQNKKSNGNKKHDHMRVVDKQR